MVNLKTKKYFLLVLIASIVFISYFSLFTIAMHRALYTAYFDLGIMDQVVYNTSQGRILQLSDPHGIKNIYRMAIHNDIFLVFLAPIYWMWQSPEALLFLQSFIVGTGIIALFFISNIVIHNQVISLLISLTYLLYPPLHGALTYNFHAVTLATSFILWMFYFLLKKKKVLMVLFLLAALSTKENVGLTVGTLLFVYVFYSERTQKLLFPVLLTTQGFSKMMIGNGYRSSIGLFIRITTNWIPQLFRYYSVELKRMIKKNKRLILLASFCFIYSVFSFFVIIPYFRQGKHVVLERYSKLGQDEVHILVSFFTKPKVVLNSFINIDSKRFFIKLFSPVGFIPFLGLIWLIPLIPELFINLLSSNWATKQIIFHYTSLMTPVIFIALIYGIKKMLQWKIPHIVIGCFLLFSSLFSWYLFGHVPFLEKTILKQPVEYARLINWAKKLKDEDIVVSGSNHTSPHVTQRKFFHYFPDGYEYSDYIVIMTNDIYNDWKDKKASIEGYEKLKKDKRFTLVDKYERLEVYKKM